jgi:hypothetical protein
LIRFRASDLKRSIDLLSMLAVSANPMNLVTPRRMAVGSRHLRHRAGGHFRRCVRPSS